MALQDLHILLVEPSLPQSRIILRHLRSMGLDKIDHVVTGAQALEHMGLHPPDLVVSAMYYEDMTGVELITAMRTREALADTPFMLISSETHPHNLEPVRQAGVLAILPKPFVVEDLRVALHTTLDYIEPDRLELDQVDVEDLRVLVVDDSSFSLRHIRHLLAQMGIEQISEAHNGIEAAEQIRDEIFDLVITDYNMPEMDGQELVNYVRHASDQPELPMLMVTSERSEARLAAVRQAGVSAICDKPFNTVNLRELITRLLSHGQADTG
ncbi:response regulator [Alkalilimnicola sp. S0819]|nr:response regulator [Alkalilimnicola sp. S0819]MPQ17654.1 response regulator [Alkalilimnicola sp. S0819]